MNTAGLSENMIDLNPFVQFEIWYKEHLASGIAIPESVSLGTSSSEGSVFNQDRVVKGL